MEESAGKETAAAQRRSGGLGMMKEQGLLMLRRIRVENANAVAGLTWGFPAVSAFLGFTHALSRKLPPEWGLTLTGCGIVCHEHEAQTHQPKGWGDHVFALSRNPLTKAGETSSFIEEGRMRLTVSLLIPFTGELPLDGEEEKAWLEEIRRLVCGQRLAGGTVLDLQEAALENFPEDWQQRRQFSRKQLRCLLPGFALVERADLLAEHFRSLREANPAAEPLDAWLDFAALKYKAELPEEGKEKAEWRHVPKPGGGWLVPLAVGYRGISKLHEPGQVAHARDSQTQFRFAETVYSVGEWLSPHRAQTLDELIWRHEAEPESGWYLCRNAFNLLKENTSWL
jgi:CRISPR-associated protein Csy2